MNHSRVWIIDERGRVAPGFYRVRLVKDGPFVPCRVWIEACERDAETGEATTDERLHVVIDCIERDRPALGWQPLIGEAITEQDYRYLTALSRHATDHEPDLPAASPHQAIDLSKAPSPF